MKFGREANRSCVGCEVARRERYVIRSAMHRRRKTKAVSHSETKSNWMPKSWLYRYQGSTRPEKARRLVEAGPQWTLERNVVQDGSVEHHIV